MTEIRFYHLQKQSLDQALPLILEKVYQTKNNAVVRLSDTKEVTRMNDILWSYKPHSFLPHGNAKTGHASAQPIWLTDKQDNPNEAKTLILTQNAVTARPLPRQFAPRLASPCLIPKYSATQ